MKFVSAAALALIGCLVGFNSANAQGAAMKTTPTLPVLAPPSLMHRQRRCCRSRAATRSWMFDLDRLGRGASTWSHHWADNLLVLA
jgi:hypothetical protein